MASTEPVVRPLGQFEGAAYTEVGSLSDTTSTCGEVEQAVSSAEAVSVAEDSGDAPPPSADASCAGDRSEGVVQSLEAVFSRLEVGGAALLQTLGATVRRPSTSPSGFF